MVKRGDLFLQDNEDGIGRITGFDAAKERIRWEVLPGLLFIGFYSVVKDGLIVRARRGLSMVVGHGGDLEDPGMIGYELWLGDEDDGLCLVFILIAWRRTSELESGRLMGAI